jgi:hypothetical protein
VDELDHDAGVGQVRLVDAAVHPPQQVDGVDVLGAEVIEQPVHGPAAQLHDHVAQVLPRRGQVVLVAPAGRRWPQVEHAHALEVAQALHEQRPRDPGEPAGDVVEAGVAEHQLPHDQGRPAVGEDLAAERDRAEPSVIRHSPMVAPARSAG